MHHYTITTYIKQWEPYFENEDKTDLTSLKEKTDTFLRKCFHVKTTEIFISTN